jgi:predicted dehydrogenase
VKEARPSGPLRVAIVGAGLMGRWHAHAVRRVGSRIVAIVDTDRARASILASRTRENPLITDDIGRAIRESKAEVVHVCSPVESHEPLARVAILAGTHVLLEKPVAHDLAVVESLHRAATEQGVLLCPVHQFLFQRGVLAAASALPTLGEIRQFDVVTCSAGADRETSAGREAIALDILPHGLALSRRLLGLELTAADWSVVGNVPGEVRLSAQLGSALVTIAVSMRARPTENSFVLRCDGGTVRGDLFHGFATIDRGQPSRRNKIGSPFVASGRAFGAASLNLLGRAVRGEPAYPGLRELVRRFHTAAANGGSPPISVAESVDVARVRDRVARERSLPIA